ncbi:hypothetical protein F2Q69_00016557 [Brassica cretica]|uniref:Uncharacterized protein n=1 Tax=Brassica cretica TaxID=69181 RepID=A0A8S9QLV3_BRACR|nr:hypothetical protein F2Q69_00016557 [Brassica cretica]
MGEDGPRRGHLAHGRGRPAPRSPRPWARTARAEVTSPMARTARARSPRPWARTARAEVTLPMGEDAPRRGHLVHGRGPTSCPETVHPHQSSITQSSVPWTQYPRLVSLRIIKERLREKL